MRSRRARDILFAPVDISWLIALRVGFGVLMIWHVVSYLTEGRVRRFWITPEFHFKYPLFEWVAPWPGDGMILHFWGLGVLAFFIAVGFLYRLSAALFFLGITQVFLIEQARYQNHVYLICLLSFLAIFLPANRAASVDALLRPSIRSQRVPAWTLWLARFQVGVPYIFGGIAKLNGDWLRGEPLREWLPRESDLPLVGRHFHEDWMVYSFSYAGLAIDLLAVPLLLWRRTRFGMFMLLFLFNCGNARLFTIGVFPWLMIVLSTAFLEPDWPRRLCADVRARPALLGSAVVVGALLGSSMAIWFNERVELAATLSGVVGGVILGWRLAAGPGALQPASAGLHGSSGLHGPSGLRRRLVLGALGIWVLGQVLIPLRRFLIPGNAAWTEEGQRFSWHMKLNDTDGQVVFYLIDPATGGRQEIDPWETLEPWQVNRIDGRPYMIRQYARHLAAEAQRAGRPGVEVRVEAWLSLNNRPAQRLVDPEVDLARAPADLGFGRAPWIVPLVVGGR